MIRATRPHELPGNADELAKRCQALYTFYRSRFEGIAYRSHPRWNGSSKSLSVWQRMAVLVLNNKLDPELLFSSVFAVWTRPDPPQPNQLCGKYALDVYRAAEEERPDEIRLAILFQVQHCTTEISRLESLMPQTTKKERERSVLLNEKLPLSALFRHALAVRRGFTQISDRYYRSAVLQYMPHAGLYDKYWGSLLSDEFRKSAMSNYQQFMLTN
jgi:hypothetical protein